MKRSKSIKQKVKLWSVTILSLVMVMSFSSLSYAEWNYGIGTGMFALNLDGTIGMNTVLAGPVELDIDLDADELSDYVETAFGFGGYATDGTWMIKLSFGYMDLEGDSQETVSGSTVDADIGFKSTGAELMASYPVYKHPSVILTLDGGIRYTKHEFESDLNITGAVTGNIKRELDNDWTDALVGATLIVPITEAWKWNLSGNAGFGGSDGTYIASTGLTWMFYKGWSGTLYYKHTAVDFESGSKGDTDWYMYDVDEFGPGIQILYNF